MTTTRTVRTDIEIHDEAKALLRDLIRVPFSIHVSGGVVTVEGWLDDKERLITRRLIGPLRGVKGIVFQE